VTAYNRFAMTVGLVAVLSAGAVMAQTSISPKPADFAMSAAQSDQYEILAARDAITQSQDPSVRGFAQDMVQDHTRSNEDLRQAVTASGLPPPPAAMSSDQALMLSALQSLRGADFDKAYARQQVLAHTQALAVEQSFVTAGSDPNLRKVAQMGVAMIQHHLERAQQLSAALGAS
jgi:putative membrane protein